VRGCGQAAASLLEFTQERHQVYSTWGPNQDSFNESEERLAQIEVRDSGKGIAPGVVARIFEPFEQAENSEGLGLGIGDL